VPGFGEMSARWRQSVVVRPADTRLDEATLEDRLLLLGTDGPIARRLDLAVDAEMLSLSSLSSLTSPLALEYLERVGRPVPSLSPQMGVQIVGRAYAAHLVVEADAASYGAPDVPVLGTLPPLRKGSPPRDLLVRVVKESRRSFEVIRAVSTPVWDGFVLCLTKRAHDLAAGAEDLVPVGSVDGLARFGWVLRQVDIHYELSPERRR
jgi:hypothetical protein